MLASQKCTTDGFITKSIARAPHPPTHLHVHSVPGSHGPEPLMMFHWIQPKRGFSDKLLGRLVRATLFSNEKNQLSSISQCYWSSLNKLSVLLKIFRNHNKIGRTSELKLTPAPSSEQTHSPLKHCFPWRRATAPWSGSLPASHTACPPAGQPVMPAGRQRLDTYGLLLLLAQNSMASRRGQRFHNEETYVELNLHIMYQPLTTASHPLQHEIKRKRGREKKREEGKKPGCSLKCHYCWA